MKKCVYFGERKTAQDTRYLAIYGGRNPPAVAGVLRLLSSASLYIESRSHDSAQTAILTYRSPVYNMLEHRTGIRQQYTHRNRYS